MSNFEEQAEELEVLASIYPSEFEQLDSETQFKIILRPDPDGQNNYGEKWTPESLNPWTSSIINFIPPIPHPYCFCHC
jgi:hypothetical protein